MFQLDINNAFLYGKLVKDVYMSIPEGYSDKDDKRVCKLVKSLYGLKQDPRKWIEKLTSVLIDNGFVQSPNNFSLVVKNDKGIMLILLVYVDDIIVTGNNIDEINKKYCTELLTEFGMLACKPCNTPIEVNFDNKKVVSKFGDDVPLTGITNYQKLVRKLIYFTMTRPDISYVVHCLSRVMHNPMQSHLRLAFRVLRYLKRKPGLGNTFKESDNADLKVFVDSDWDKCKIIRRSITGYVVFLETSLVSWKKVNGEWHSQCMVLTLLLLSAYAPSMPPLLSLPLSMARDDSDLIGFLVSAYIGCCAVTVNEAVMNRTLNRVSRRHMIFFQKYIGHNYVGVQCLEQVLRSVVEGVGGLMNSNLQDDEVGDGNTFMVVWPRELLREAEKLLSMKIQPMTIVYLYGAHVISWKNEHNEKMIFTSSKVPTIYKFLQFELCKLSRLLIPNTL
ncbi:ribonuclease H-like domain-containing protein [Tanacetum coccineum]